MLDHRIVLSFCSNLLARPWLHDEFPFCSDLLLTLEFVIVDEHFELEHEVPQEEQIHPLVILLHIISLIEQNTAPNGILHQIERLDLLHILLTAPLR